MSVVEKLNEIIKGLREYVEFVPSIDGVAILMQAADLIEELQAEVMAAAGWQEELEASKRMEMAAVKDLKYYLESNEENGVVYIPKFVIERMVKLRGSEQEGE